MIEVIGDQSMEIFYSVKETFAGKNPHKQAKDKLVVFKGQYYSHELWLLTNDTQDYYWVWSPQLNGPPRPIGVPFGAYNVLERSPPSDFALKGREYLRDKIHMTIDELAFLRSIVDAPKDELPKKIYADWLDEHGRWTEALYWRDEKRKDTLNMIRIVRSVIAIEESKNFQRVMKEGRIKTDQPSGE
jgi:uncharacterized protein (TIGR02996 family)